jgi:hypothetical protein
MRVPPSVGGIMTGIEAGDGSRPANGNGHANGHAQQKIALPPATKQENELPIL